MKIADVYHKIPFTPVKAKGATIWDAEGKAYMDFYGGHGVISIGHSHPLFLDRIISQINNLAFYSNAVSIPLQEEAAAAIGRVSGKKNYQLFLCNSGTESVENALKTASFINGRRKVIAFENGFHGRTSLAVNVTDNQKIQPPVNSQHEVILLPMEDIDRFQQEMDESVCAVIIEGIQGIGGIHVPTKGFWNCLRKACDKYGSLLIADEVQSGFGRSGKFFAHELAEVEPDIITMAKGMGNGFPVGGIAIHDKFPLSKGMLGSTFGGNHLACQAVIAVCETIEQENLMENANGIGAEIMERLKKIDGIKAVRGSGLMIAMDLDGDSAWARKKLLNDHQIIVGSSTQKETIRILPPLNITHKEVDIFIDCISQTLESQQ